MNGLNTLIMQRLKSKPKMKRICGIIKKVIENTNNTKFQVSVFNNNNEKHDIVLLNKTKEVLQEGDTVWIHYWNTITDGYIAIKIGLSSFGSGGGSVIERPLHCEAAIIDSYRFNKKNSLISNTYSYTIEEQSVQESRSPNPFGEVLFANDKRVRAYTSSGTFEGGVLQFGHFYGTGQVRDVELYPQPYIYTDIVLPVGNSDGYDNLDYSKNVRYMIRRVDTDIQLIRIDGEQTKVELTITNASDLNEFGFYFDTFYLNNAGSIIYLFNAGLYMASFNICLAEKVNGAWVWRASTTIKTISELYPTTEYVIFQVNSINVTSQKCIVTQTSTIV